VIHPHRLAHFVLAVVIFGAGPTTAADRAGSALPGAKIPLNILFIGNSYTMPLPSMFQELLNSAGYEVYLDQVSYGGWILEYHAASLETIARINSRQWDYVVLQEQSQIPSLPLRVELMYPAVRTLDQIIRAAGSKPVLFMTWGRRDGDLEHEPNDHFDWMTERLRQGYYEIGLEVGAYVAPVGMAWHLSVHTDPTVNLWEKDGSHPNPAGVYLNACMFFATLFDRDLSGVTTNGPLSPELALFLRQIAIRAAQQPRIY